MLFGMGFNKIATYYKVPQLLAFGTVNTMTVIIQMKRDHNVSVMMMQKFHLGFSILTQGALIQYVSQEKLLLDFWYYSCGGPSQYTLDVGTTSNNQELFDQRKLKLYNGQQD